MQSSRISGWPTNSDQFDVKGDLEKKLKTRTVNGFTNVMFTDIFVLSHGDDDHLHGFKKNFYQGDPKDFKQKNKDDKEIVIDVLWFSPMVMGVELIFYLKYFKGILKCKPQ